MSGQLEVMLEYLERGYSRRETAELLGVDRTTIDNRIRKLEGLLSQEQGGRNADHDNG